MNLVIVESPHKAATIQKFLGNDYKVVSSKGHIRDLQENELSVDIEHGFVPKYIIPSDKKKTVGELAALAKKADMVYLASDEDREGEAIAWHLQQTLKLDPEKTRRITFHEITKNAILEALKNPRGVDMNLVDAQQARRVLDRLVGYELSPVLWRKIKRGLSAGRVQSVALRLVTDKEREVLAFEAKPFYRVEAEFAVGKSKVKGTLEEKFQTEEEARQFLQDSIGAVYTITFTDKKEGSRYPVAPFTTSTLQQEAGRKLRFSVSQTMRLAQSLYEHGLITYMRTDSTNLSSLALNTAKAFIIDNFGEEYSHPRQFKTHSKGAQEAHEAIRPTFIENTQIEGTPQEQKLYNLIWRRTLASQMAEARLLNTNIKVGLDRRSEHYLIQSSEILFDGFLKLYMEGSDDLNETEDENSPKILPPMNPGDILTARKVDAVCKFTQAPYRYSEPSLVKKLEELGIGRPSTYAPTISTLTTGRGYLVKGDKEGTNRTVTDYTLRDGVITSGEKTEKVGAEKGKLLPTDIGMAVSDYLVENFSDILDYGFTADIENDFDKVAEGRTDWQKCMQNFYPPFHSEVDKALSSKDYRKVEREIGIDPADGKMIVARLGQFGPYVQKGEDGEKICASLADGQLIESITLEEALKLFSLPRTVGALDGKDIVIRKGRFGAYLQWDGQNFSLPRGTDPLKITLGECEALIKKAPAKGPLHQWGEITVLVGPYGPYIKASGKNYKLPKGTDPDTITEQQCREIISQGAPTRKTTKKK